MISRRRTLGPALLVLALGAPAAAQDGGPPIGPGRGPQAQQQDDLMELFAEVERKLREIDLMLSDAGAGEIPLALPPESGISDLLEATQSESRSVVEGIDRILEIARQNGGSASPPPPGQPPQPGGQEPQPGSGSPTEQDPNQTPGDRERTPEMPGEDQPGGDEPQQPGEQDQPGGDQPQDQEGDGDQPDDPQGSDQPGENREATGEPPGADPGGAANPAGDDAWGDLPPRAREVFRMRGSDDLPAEYRSWIDAYYRRLNKAVD